MRLKNLSFGSVLAMAATLAVATGASASIVEDVFTGKVISGSDTKGIFGAPGSSLAGDSFISTFLFDDNLGYRTTYKGSDYPFDSVLGDQNATPALGATLTINDHTFFFSGGEDSGFSVQKGATIDDQDDVDGPLSPITFIEEIGASSTIPSSLDVPFTTSLSPAFSVFNIGLDVSEFGDGSSLATGMLNSTSVTALVFPGPPTPSAPEPSSWALMLAGIGGIGMALRRSKRRTERSVQGAIPS